MPNPNLSVLMQGAGMVPRPMAMPPMAMPQLTSAPFGGETNFLRDVLAQKLAAQGRGEDNAAQGGGVAHLSAWEMDLLKRLGGAATINPSTGLPQFYDSGEGRGGNPDSGDLGGAAAGGYGGAQGFAEDVTGRVTPAQAAAAQLGRDAGFFDTPSIPGSHMSANAALAANVAANQDPGSSFGKSFQDIVGALLSATPLAGTITAPNATIGAASALGMMAGIPGLGTLAGLATGKGLGFGNSLGAGSTTGFGGASSGPGGGGPGDSSLGGGPTGLGAGPTALSLPPPVPPKPAPKFTPFAGNPFQYGYGPAWNYFQ
jgi:hypothetical protein